jgi:hypothetical protein
MPKTDRRESQQPISRCGQASEPARLTVGPCATSIDAGDPPTRPAVRQRADTVIHPAAAPVREIKARRSGRAYNTVTVGMDNILLP